MGASARVAVSRGPLISLGVLSSDPEPSPQPPRGVVSPSPAGGTAGELSPGDAGLGPHRTPDAALAQVPGTAPGLASPVGRDGRASRWLTCRRDTVPSAGSSLRPGSKAGGQGGSETGLMLFPDAAALRSRLLAGALFQAPGGLQPLAAAAAAS